ncbi:hypothetical protein [Demequina lutea]|uniref:TadE-like protein n=1 Tax=Demequina lutea TaxID=431489 RepID=A0A7Y9ZD01_9MICO|nr:hypothetical protein [Demequina lutea]NYI42846.1 hypothetical protein [Demequina lutea]
MADPLEWARPRSDRPADEGAAIVEFIALSLLLLVPLLYLVVTLSRIQAGAFAAEGAAHEAARAAVVTGVASREHGSSRETAMAAGASRAEAAVALVADDFRFDSDDASLALSCEGPCLEPGGNVDAEVTVVVALPGIPGFLTGALPLSVDVVGSARAPVDSVVNDQ